MQVDIRITPFEGSDNGVKGFASVTFCGAFTVSKVSIVENACQGRSRDAVLNSLDMHFSHDSN